jgi:tRNA threonylcarbamoyladenosine biosynthesis protein TsaE
MELSLAGIEQYANDFVRALPSKRAEHAFVVGLRGNLGAGKTTLVQAIARALGVKEGVTSPTFVIAQTYKTTHPVFTQLVHMDAYRLEGEEKDTIGFTAYTRDPNNIIFVEWPECLPRDARVPANATILEFETLDEATRRIQVHE